MNRAIALAGAVLVASALIQDVAAPLGSAALSAQHLHPEAPPVSPADTAGLGQQLAKVRAITARYLDHANAVADGYQLFGIENALMGEHWYLPDQMKRPLDLGRPSTLQYATIGGKRQLVGVAFSEYRRPGDPIPEGFVGPLDEWHEHDVTQLARAITQDRPLLRLLANIRIATGRVGGGDGRTMLTMIHAWPQLENPDGMFAQVNRALPYLRAGLPASFANGADENAAWGVSLLTPGSCDAEITRMNALTNLTSAQRPRLTSACAEAEAAVKAVPDRASSAERLNAAAAAAWKRYLDARDALLTAEQEERMRSLDHQMMGPGPGGC